MFQKLTSIIFIGPSTSIFPLSNSKYPQFLLPIANIPLLSLNIRWISEISNRIIIVVIDDNKKMVEDCVRISNVKNEVIIHCIEEYIGTYKVLLQIIDSIIGEYFLFFKGDLFTDFKAEDLIKKKINGFGLVLFKEEKKSCTNLVGYNKRNLLYYTEDLKNRFEIDYKFIKQNKQIQFSTKFKLLQLYIFNKKLLNDKFEGFSFRNEILPQILNLYKSNDSLEKIVIKDSEIYRIESKENYLLANDIYKKNKEYSLWSKYDKSNEKEFVFQYICNRKNRVSFKSQPNRKKTIVGSNFVLNENVVIYNSNIGDSVIIGNNVQIENSIIMNNVKIGDNCIIKNCIIGTDSILVSNCNLNDCFIACGSEFKEKVNAKNKNFVRIDF